MDGNRKNTLPGILHLPPSVTPTLNFILQVGRAVLLENDETRQANGVGAEEDRDWRGKGRGRGVGWEERGKEKFLRGTTKYSMTRPAGRKTAALSVPEEESDFTPPLRLPPSPALSSKASGWSGPLGAVDTAGGRTDSFGVKGAQIAYTRKAKLCRGAQRSRGKKEGGDDCWGETNCQPQRLRL